MTSPDQCEGEGWGEILEKPRVRRAFLLALVLSSIQQHKPNHAATPNSARVYCCQQQSFVFCWICTVYLGNLNWSSCFGNVLVIENNELALWFWRTLIGLWSSPRALELPLSLTANWTDDLRCKKTLSSSFWRSIVGNGLPEQRTKTIR